MVVVKWRESRLKAEATTMDVEELREFLGRVMDLW